MTKPVPVICLSGPTASGKTPLAIELVQRFPCEIISVDSAMIYRGMDIGTAKPDAAVLRLAPHRLIDILDPREVYSAGQFRRDAWREIGAIRAQGKIPLLVGGTMLYFRVLQQGLADLPPADPSLRASLLVQAESEGWEALHQQLNQIDAPAAARIHPHDAQRIQRALEVYQLTGKTITAWQEDKAHSLAVQPSHHLALLPSDRRRLHERIAQRFQHMLEQGLLAEVEQLYTRTDLSPDLPSLRSVGYRQAWAYLAGHLTFDEMKTQAIAATRQLAKRQMTWLRAWPALTVIDTEATDVSGQVERWLEKVLSRYR